MSSAGGRSSASIAAGRARFPASASVILDRRDLRTGNPGVIGLVRPGMRVLDVGCGSGSISRAIATEVGRAGHVLAVDCQEELINRARRHFGHVGNLQFAVFDGCGVLPGDFDLACCSRMLQWLPDPQRAVRAMADAVKPGGFVQLFDYDHLQAEWHPDLPPAMRHFYEALLTWRSDAGMDNRVGRRLAQLLARAGLIEIFAQPMPHVCRRQPGHDWEHASVWADVAATRGHQLVRDGYISDAERLAAEAEYRCWLAGQGALHVLALVSAHGRRPGSSEAAQAGRAWQESH